MNEERLSRHITQENLKLRSENSHLKSQMEAKEIMLDNKDDEIVRLLNQIASDMVKRSDVDEIVRNAVAEEHDRLVDYYEGKMKSMAAEYEAKIADLQKSKKRNTPNGNSGGSGTRRVSKGDTQTFDTKEDALAALDAAQKKLKSMTDLAFGGGGEKLSHEQKIAIDPEEENADDDSLVKAPIKPRGNYGHRDYDPIPRPDEYCNYGEIDEEDTVHNDIYPEGCDATNTSYGERTFVQWEVTLPKLYKVVNHLHRCLVKGKKVWAKMPKTMLGNAHRGPKYTANMILNKYLNGMAENKTQRAQKYQIGMDISRKTVNTHINLVLKRIRLFMEDRYKWWVLQDPYLAVDETTEDVFVIGEDGKRHLRCRYHWGIRTSLTNLVYFIYDKGSRCRDVIVGFLDEYVGTIQTDGASMYKIFETNEKSGITRLSCLVHIRRYFYKALKFEDESGIARRFLDKIQLIYKFEKQYKKDKLSPETIKENRERDILPILGDILQDLTRYANNATHECGELLMKAIHYAQAEWKGLMEYTKDGHYRADNNYAEQIMRDLATGRKNFMFSGSDEAAKNLAFAYSLTQSCKLCGVNLYEYWEDLLTNGLSPNRTVDSFIPHLWKKNL